MGIYVFNANILERPQRRPSREAAHDFGKDIIPAMISAADRVYAYRYEGYWVDVGTVDLYWATSLELLQPNPALDLYNDQWPVHHRSEERPPAKIGPQAKVVSSMVSNGCVIRGVVVNSVLSPGVYVSPGAVVQDSVIMNDTWIGPGARLDKVVDKKAVIGAGAIVGTGDHCQRAGCPIASSPASRLSRSAPLFPMALAHRPQRPNQQQPGRRRLSADKIVADGKTI